jgi:hypothetical protein
MSSYNVSNQNMVLNQPQPGGVTIASSGITTNGIVKFISIFQYQFDSVRFDLRVKFLTLTVA